MYHEDEGNVDVELLAECGQIAQRLRSLEKLWTSELKELQRKTLLTTFSSPPPLITSLSVTQKLNEIFDLNENEAKVDENNQELVSRLKYLEDTVIKIHYQQELLRQTTALVKRNAASHKRVHIKGNMNYSTSSGNNNDLSTSQSPTAAIHEQLIGSNNGEHATGSGDNNNKRNILNKDDDDDMDQSSMTTTQCKQSQSIYNQQQQLCGRIGNDDLRMLLRELKKKVDYTEKMNWLCKFLSKHILSFLAMTIFISSTFLCSQSLS